MISLLDINVLIALLDSSHTMHQMATEWLNDNLADGWSSCPITQNGVIRIMSQPAYPNFVGLSEISSRFSQACDTDFHQFWPDEVSLFDGCVLIEKLLGHKQITDAYLLALAVHNGGRFITFDKRVSAENVKNATQQHLIVIS